MSSIQVIFGFASDTVHPWKMEETDLVSRIEKICQPLEITRKLVNKDSAIIALSGEGRSAFVKRLFAEFTENYWIITIL